MRTFLQTLERKPIKLRFVATTPQERNQGLMHQEPLKPDEGALFVYETPTTSGFWNKDVDFPISIGFFNMEGKLFDIRHLQPNQTTEVKPRGEFVYALEVPHGFFVQRDIGTNLRRYVDLG